MDSRIPLIIGGWLPDDESGGRTGKPDLLIRVAGGYLPGDVKNHKVLKRAKTASAVLSTTTEPGLQRLVRGWTTATSHRPDDGMQLAHYTRMLQACGHHAGDEQLRGAIIGSDRVPQSSCTPESLTLSWHDLSEPMIYTFSRRRGKTRRSLLERYDHEHAFRIEVAHRALQMTGSLDDPEPLVTPIGQAECATCPYEETCADLLGADDPSISITVGRLDTREWRTLRSMGINTTSDLVNLDIDDRQFLDQYMADVTHRSLGVARTRLAQAVERASMIATGTEIALKVPGPVEVPSAAIEVDVDVESDGDGRVYMWGVRMRSGSDEATATYIREFVDWCPMSDDSERVLATRFVKWLRHKRTAVEAEGQTLRAFHWAHPEWSNLRRILGPEAVRDLIGDRDSQRGDPEEQGIFLDLEKFVKASFTTLRGTGLKRIAPLFGFHWRAEDAGGATSQAYLITAQSSGDSDQILAARGWLYSYNEDDNAAMAAVRDGIRRMTSPRTLE